VWPRGGNAGAQRLGGGPREFPGGDGGCPLVTRDQSGSGIFWCGPGHGNENKSERNGGATQEHAVYERGDDFGAGTMVGRNWQRGASGSDQLEGRGVGPVQRNGGASQCEIRRAGAAVTKHFAEVGSA